MAILEATELNKIYTVNQFDIQVLDGVSLSVEPGEFIVITGSSGSGKTTLLTILSGLDKPTSGRVVIDRQDITVAAENDLAHMRNRMIGFVFQSFHLVPSMTAKENIMFPAELLGNLEAEAKAMRLLERVGLTARADNLPSQLSGGEKQRISLCRAMVNDPMLLFADEPTGNLDTKTSEEIMELLLRLNSGGMSIIMVTHSHQCAQYARRILKMADGPLFGRSKYRARCEDDVRIRKR